MSPKLGGFGARMSAKGRAVAWSLFDRNPTLLRLAKAMTRGERDRSRRIPRALGVEGMIKEMERRNVRYLVLRWFDALPETSGDLDLLIADEDAANVRSLLTQSPEKGHVQCDAYSVSGLPRHDYHGLPHLPPAQAESMLRRAVRHESGARVPDVHDHFLSLAFHAIYHKGPKSGIPRDSGSPTTESRRPYLSTLERLAGQLGLGIPVTMRSLDGYLGDNGWRPSLDMLIKLGIDNEWCRIVADHLQRDLPTVAGLSVGVIRAAASDDQTVAHIIAQYEAWGFRVLNVRRLTEAERARASASIRGGNWGKGPWPKSGGEPAVMITAIDPNPKHPSQELLRKQPGTDNERVVELKTHLRRWWNSNRPSRQRANIVHTSDGADHAWHYLQVILNRSIADFDELIDLLAPTMVSHDGQDEAGSEA